MGRRKRQTHLTFEPVVAGGDDSSSQAASPKRNFSPANVRYSQHGVRIRSRPRLLVTQDTTSNASKKSERKFEQSRLPTSQPRSEQARFMPKTFGSSGRSRPRPVLMDSSDESAVEVVNGDSESDLAELPPPAGTQEVPQVIADDEDDSDSDDIPLPTSASKIPRSSQLVATRLAKAVISDDKDEKSKKRPRVEDDSDGDDGPILPPSSARRHRPVTVDLDDSEDEEIVSPAKRRRIHQSTPRRAALDSEHSDSASPKRTGRLLRTPQILSSPTKRTRHKGHRSEKQKKMELLRRRRAGEKITQLTDSESSDDGDKRAMYDTDSDGGLQMLKEFDDDDEEEEQEGETQKKQSARSRKSSKASPRKSQKARESEGSEDLDDFVVEDDEDTPLGAPAMLDIPLQFTQAAHLPLKEQFPYVVEWLVHNRINPAFDRKDAVYVNAWRKLNDEFRGLANSKFSSSAWKAEFYRSLKGRPKMEAYEVGTGGALFNDCEACGRTNHPATWKIVFQGSPYDKETLEDLESSDSDSEDKDDDDDAEEDTRSRDSQDMPLAPTSKEWHVGKVCCSNAETAHTLLHWKYHLKEFVEEKLEDEGWNKAKKLQEREKMKAKKRRALANGIVDDWLQRKVISGLYQDFKNTLETARNKATTGSRGGGGWR